MTKPKLQPKVKYLPHIRAFEVYKNGRKNFNKKGEGSLTTQQC
jgi:hypothetical protein